MVGCQTGHCLDLCPDVLSVSFPRAKYFIAYEVRSNIENIEQPVQYQSVLYWESIKLSQVTPTVGAL